MAVSDRWFNAVLYAFVPVCLLALVIFAVYWCYRRQMYLQFVKNQIVSDTNGKMNGYANAGPLRPITLIDVRVLPHKITINAFLKRCTLYTLL